MAAQISPPLEEKELTKIFLKTLSSFYCERLIASSPNDFTEMVNMGMRLEGGVREGRLSKEEASASKKYDELYPSLVLKYLIQPRNPPQVPEPLPWWFKPDLHCDFHQGAPGHDIESFYPLNTNPRGCMIIKKDIQKLMDENVVIQFDSSSNNNVNRSVSPLVIRLAGPVPYSSDKCVPYQYNATMIEDGQEVPLPITESVVNIADITKVTRSGRVFNPDFPKTVEDVSVSKKVEIPVVNPVSAPMCQSANPAN
ncbi:hypothetical protein KIW84_022583 [Lathyrus oleraceus]|uniref:Uncharacterized protein n=1 Tax=Pisum sativum TaxID=3888 RepID=A0A9D5BAX5_PEA|nr:hypothetical protein KIW84_022583 [Pisum sativum]